MSNRGLAAGLLAIAAAVGLGVRSVEAGKPSGGGGTGGGTIYFAVAGQTWSMASDGSGKTQLPLPAGAPSLPSHALHGGHRWFLTTKGVAGTNPDGTPRFELFAVRGDGAVEVQVTDDDAVRVFSCAWARDDSFLSFSAVDWTPSSGPVSVIRRVSVTFDAGGAFAPAAVATDVVTAGVEVPVSGGVRPFVAGPHDWAPGGDQVAWCEDDDGPTLGLQVTTLSTTSTVHLATGSWPCWSNDGAAIVFTGTTGIESISPAGTGRKTLVRDGVSYGVHRAMWSPSGSHIAYSRTGTDYSGDVYRATASGASRTDLTSDVSDHAFSVAWR